MNTRCLSTLAALCCCWSLSAAPAKQPPNVILILADDLGFSDLGCYGGEIETPHLDRLAAGGLRFTQFYNCAKCETTRATLLSGRYHHEVGIGKLQHCVTLGEAMRTAGYTTLMSGKWHMEGHPMDRGFDRYFGHLSGACNYFTGDNTFYLGRDRYSIPAEGFYTTDANTDHAIRFLKKTDRESPFFLYLAYNAPHYPLHAPRAEVEKYRGRYRDGWDVLRQERLARLRAMNLLGREYALPPRPDDVPAWDTLTAEERERQELMMAAYAGMVDRLDQNIGRVIKTLEEMEVFDNTLLVFLSDNGACPFQRTTPVTLKQNLMPWDAKSYWTYGKGWAHACNTPFREYKRDQHEGGITTPFIAHWPEGIPHTGGITHQPAHLVDLMATFLDLAGSDYPREFNGHPVGPARGQSLRPILVGAERAAPEYLHFTFYGQHNALRVGPWKLVNKDRGPWELYHLQNDRTELDNRIKAEPERAATMMATWTRLAQEFGVPQKRSKAK